MYVPTLVEVPATRPLELYQTHGPSVLDQGQEGACTGFGLAAVANYLLATRRDSPDPTPVSTRMLYEMAKRNDEWAGEDYEGSSARGAMKGWHKFGVCSEDLWPYKFGKSDPNPNHPRLDDARKRPLGAYFRVNHRDLVAMHSAISETGILFATAMVHGGWDAVKKNGTIQYSAPALGGHAFAIVGYDSKGFWIQNSWGDGWGKEGFAHLSYYDWLQNGTDAWVARLGAPVQIDSPIAYAAGTFPSAQMGQAFTAADLRPHIVSLGNDGLPSDRGDFANTTEEIRNFIRRDFLRITADWPKKRILLYAHGGLVGEKGAVQRVAEYREAMLKAQVYPLAFIWHSDFWSTLGNILSEAFRRRKSEGILDATKDFMLDRLDDTLEPIARHLGGKAQWSEMKENAIGATTHAGGGARTVIHALKALVAEDPSIDIHIAGHSAGSIFMGPVISAIAKFSTISTCHLWAPACTVPFFKKHYLPHLSGPGRRIRELALYTLSDRAEQDDHCARIYNKSLLYLVSRAFEEEYEPFRWKWPGAPILGMAKFIDADPEIHGLFSNKSATWIVAPNNHSEPLLASGSTSHGGFDDDEPTVRGTLARIVDASSGGPVTFTASAGGSLDRLHKLRGI
ncbi:C1 family peptidase [Haloferula sargassicola]|uniref:Peptidase C1A papain C-terminal domain-containing protein n=1 Tax=Haloferula sargassicola TaxID=490096 RepID=A0ABP9ULJ7_9BACT